MRPSDQINQNVTELPLHNAIKNNDLEKVQQLLEQGAKVNEQNAFNPLPIAIAIKQKNLAIIKLLLKQDGLELIAEMYITTRPESFGYKTPFSALCLAYKIDQKLFDFLFQEIINLEKQGKANVAECILADDETDYVCGTVTEKLIDNNDIPRIRKLLDYIDINVYDCSGFRLLDHAAFGCELKTLQFLLAEGADVNGQDENEENTPLHTLILKYADGKPTYELIKYILIYTPNINLINDKGNTPLDLIVKYGTEDIAKLIFDKNIYQGKIKAITFNKAFLKAIKRQEDNKDLLTSSLPDFEEKIFYSQTLQKIIEIFSEIAQSNLSNIEDFLKKIEEDNGYTNLIMDINQNTVLHYVVANKNFTTSEKISYIETLLKFGTDPYAQNLAGKCALHFTDNLDIKSLLKTEYQKRLEFLLLDHEDNFSLTKRILTKQSICQIDLEYDYKEKNIKINKEKITDYLTDYLTQIIKLYDVDEKLLYPDTVETLQNFIDKCNELRKTGDEWKGYKPHQISSEQSENLSMIFANLYSLYMTEMERLGEPFAEVAKQFQNNNSNMPLTLHWKKPSEKPEEPPQKKQKTEEKTEVPSAEGPK